MPIKDKQELFVWMLSDLRHGAERSNKIYEHIAEIAQDPDIKEALNARAFISDKIQKTLDECFRIIGQKPVDTKGRLHEVLAEDFRNEIAEIDSKEGRRLFILSKMNRLTHMRISEYEVLIALADFTGHYAVGVLLETCLADKMVFVERTRELLRRRVEQRMAA
jgi:ferritin-like metal-binding protein YciE